MKFPFVKKSTPMAEPRNGILLGYPEDGSLSPMYVAPDVLQHHSLVIGRANTGKTNLIKLLASAAMERDLTLVVVDTDGDLAPALLELVPPRRAEQVDYFDFSITQQVVGLNLLDLSTARYADRIVSAIVQASELLWKERWGVLPEDALRMGLYTLLKANQVLASRNQDQFTLLDVAQLFELPFFRRRLLKQFVPDSAIHWWWGGYYEQMYQRTQSEISVPLLARIRPLAQNPVPRHILGQPKSAINFRELLSERRIVLINLVHTTIRPEVRQWLGTLLADLLSVAVFDRGHLGERKMVEEPPAPVNTVVVFHGFQPVSVLDDPYALAGLQRREVNCIFAFQSLTNLETVKPVLIDQLLSNLTNLFVFRSTLRDAERLSAELCTGLAATDLIELPDHVCVTRTQQGNQRLPARRMQTMWTPERFPSCADQILRRMESRVCPVDQAEESRQRFEQIWYGREASLLRTMIQDEPSKESPRRNMKAQA